MSTEGEGYVPLIDRMLKFAREGGDVHNELMRLRAAVEAGNFLGPTSRKFLQHRLEEMEATECRHLGRDGICRGIARKGQCDFIPTFRKCDIYAPMSSVSGDPMRAGR